MKSSLLEAMGGQVNLPSRSRGGYIVSRVCSGGPMCCDESSRSRWAATKQLLRDNAAMLLGQAHLRRQLATRADIELLRIPALPIVGGTSSGPAPIVLQMLASHNSDVQVEVIPYAIHVMFEQDSGGFC
jgi:pimeloyl-ACP methyl ester carboxylesterase